MLSIVSTFFVLRWLFRKQLSYAIESEVPAVPLTLNGKFVLAGIAAMVAVLLAASSLGMDLGLPTCLVSLAITAAVSLKTRCNPLRLAREISWETLALVVSLFVMVDSVENIGAMQNTLKWLAWANSLGLWLGTIVTGFVGGVANNLVNNLPLGLIAGGTIQFAHTKGPIADAVLIGVDLGPNLSITGSLATILWLIALRKEKLDVSFWSFLKVGIVAMPIALLISVTPK